MVLDAAAAARRWRQAVPCEPGGARSLGSEIAAIQVSYYRRNAVGQRSRQGTRRVAREARSCRALQNRFAAAARVLAKLFCRFMTGFWVLVCFCASSVRQFLGLAVSASAASPRAVQIIDQSLKEQEASAQAPAPARNRAAAAAAPPKARERRAPCGRRPPSRPHPAPRPLLNKGARHYAPAIVAVKHRRARPTRVCSRRHYKPRGSTTRAATPWPRWHRPRPRSTFV